MTLTLKTNKIKIDNKEYTLRLCLILGWHIPNLSLRLPNMTINHTVFTAIFSLMTEYAILAFKYDSIKR